MLPKEKLKEIEEGKNEIYNFWKVRGYEEVMHTLGMNITFHRKQKYETLGLSLQYLEQFKEIATREIDELLLSVLTQACAIEDGQIDNRCLSDYEEACNYLTDKGYLKTKNGRIYEIIMFKKTKVKR